MNLNLSLWQKGLILITVPLVFEIGTFILLLDALNNAEKEIRIVAHARDVNVCTNRISKLVMGAAASLYSYHQSGDSDFLERYDQSAVDAHQEFATLRQLMQNDAQKQAVVSDMESTYSRALMYLDEARRARRLGDKPTADSYIQDLKDLSPNLSAKMNEFSASYKRVEQDGLKRQEAARTLLKQELFLAIVLSIVIAALLSWFFYKKTMERVLILGDNARRFAQGQDLQGLLSGNDELSAVDKTFHEMAQSISLAAKQKQELMAMITHDLRTPLTSVSGTLLRVLENRSSAVLPDSVVSSLETSQANVDRLINLVSDLLDVDKIEAGKLKLTLEQTPFAYVLENSLNATMQLAKDKQVTIDSPETELEVLADGDRLVQVLTNLLGNAIQHSSAGQCVRITVTLVENNFVECRVIDTGLGIAPEKLETIFQRFEQAKASRRGSSGLGLAICKEIVALHNGQIGVESVVGQGTQFWFRLPPNQEALSLTQGPTGS